MSRENTSVNPVTILIIIISIMLIGGLVRNAISLRQARQRLETTKQQVAELEAKKAAIEKAAAAQSDPTALDQAIRNKLNLAKPGETLVLITGTTSADLLPSISPHSSEEIPPIFQWWQLLNPSK